MRDCPRPSFFVYRGNELNLVHSYLVHSSSGRAIHAPVNIKKYRRDEFHRARDTRCLAHRQSSIRRALGWYQPSRHVPHRGEPDGTPTWRRRRLGGESAPCAPELFSSGRGRKRICRLPKTTASHSEGVGRRHAEYRGKVGGIEGERKRERVHRRGLVEQNAFVI